MVKAFRLDQNIKLLRIVRGELQRIASRISLTACGISCIARFLMPMAM